MTIETLAHAYNAFQHHYGQSMVTNVQHVIENLFAPAFKKIVNGATLVGKRDDLESQLAHIKLLTGPWVIKPSMIIPSADNQQCTIRYSLITENAGTFDVIAIISSGDNQTIHLIDEVYYQVND
jgi:hypothetical protein